MNIKDLIKRCKKNDRAAQNELFEKYKNTLYFLSLKYCRNEADAEDNTHDAFITIFEKIKSFKGKGSFEGWIKRITVNTVLQKYRKQRVYSIEDEAQIEEEDNVTVDTETVPLDFLLKIIQELPDQYRLVFTLYVLDDYSHKEIAKMLGISDGTSKSNLARARGILKTKIDNYKP
ncbi:MAG TPA: RNA polymerase subunit sigma-70 [Flavobacteriaceae bacterium]|nr:RNA polymerase subunit sigma-70 [Flavobacteriaceae bacterium]